MKSKFSIPLILLIVSTLVLTGCGGQCASAEGYGMTEFVEELRANGVEADMGDSVQQAFFSVTGNYVNFNGESIQVFEYELRNRCKATPYS